MKASEICIGDWFKAIDYNSPFRITAIYDDVVQTQADYQSEIDGNWYSEAEIKDLVPIPLTEDILVKNGFEKTTNDWNRHRPLIIFESIGFPTISIHADMDMKHFWVHGTIDLTYVHTLQHLLRLCGIEKELTI